MKTDNQLQQDVIAELNWEPSIDAAQIGVEVQNGVVTLAGEVNSFVEKWSAESAAQRVFGVKALAINLNVKLSGSSKRTDADIVRSAENALQCSSYFPNDTLKVMVEDGWITLSGEADWQYQKLAAADALRYLVGVVGISNQISIKARLTSDSIKSDIESAFRRRANGDANNIGVEVLGNDVTLTGKVHSWSERELASQTAWATHGVWKVTDNITVY